MSEDEERELAELRRTIAEHEARIAGHERAAAAQRAELQQARRELAGTRRLARAYLAIGTEPEAELELEASLRAAIGARAIRTAFDPARPRVRGFAVELAHLWAILFGDVPDAALAVATGAAAGQVAVSILRDGAAMPDAQEQHFAASIVERHRGRIEYDADPARLAVRVILPVA